MSLAARLRQMVAAAGLTVQHRCAGCGARLEAYGREGDESERWSCGVCAIAGATVAEKYRKSGAS